MTKIRDKTIQLLARREHSQVELARKLAQKGFSQEEISGEFEYLQKHDLQSDARFAESYVRARKIVGFGPRRIAVELRSKGVSETLIERFVDENSPEWWEIMIAVCERRFSKADARDKQFRFLLQRGFMPEAIHRWLRHQKVNSNDE